MEWTDMHGVIFSGIYLWLAPGELLGNATLHYIEVEGGVAFIPSRNPAIRANLVCPANKGSIFYGPIPNPR